jgi:Arabinose efflux permease
MTLLTYTGQIKYWHILVLSTLFGLTQTLDMPGRQSFFIDLVGSENVTNAISLNSTIVNLARIVGPAVSGIVMVQRGIVFCFFVNALSYIPVIVGMILIKVPANTQKAGKSIKGNVVSDIVDGISYIKKSEILVANVLIMAVVCTFAMNNDVIIPVFAKDVLGRGAEAYTGLLSMAGLGAFIGAIMMSYISKFGVNKKLLLISGVSTGILQVLTVTTKLYLICQLLVLSIGFFNLVFINIANAIFQVYSSNEFRGRVMSVYSFLNQGSTPIGNFFAGGVMESMGGVFGFLSCGAITLLLLGMVYLYKGKAIREWFAV